MINNNSFYSESDLLKIGFKEVGENVLISRKCSFYGSEQISIGDNVRIDDFCILSGKIKLGNYIHVSAYVGMFGGNVGIEMHDFSTVSSRTSIYAISDDYSGEVLTNSMIPAKYRNVINGKVVIERHVIIGAGSVILPGVVLSEGSSFGAMSLIIKNSDPWSINVGIPAKRIKSRSKKLLSLEKRLKKEDTKNEK